MHYIHRLASPTSIKIDDNNIAFYTRILHIQNRLTNTSIYHLIQSYIAYIYLGQVIQV